MYIYTPLCRYWIAIYRYVLVFIVPHVNIELEDNKQFISNIPRILERSVAITYQWLNKFYSIVTSPLPPEAATHITHECKPNKNRGKTESKVAIEHVD